MPEPKLSEEFEKGWKHFCECLNFGDSAMDAEAIAFMNETPSKVLISLKIAEHREELPNV